MRRIFSKRRRADDKTGESSLSCGLTLQTGEQQAAPCKALGKEAGKLVIRMFTRFPYLVTL